MKKLISTVALLLIFSASAWSQAKPIKVVFDITSKDTLDHQTVMRHVKGMSESYPQSQFEVVVYGGALPMFMNGKSTVAKDISQLAANKNIAFKACAGTMKRYNVDKSQLLSGVDVVPDAIMEIVTKQSEGWGYIKESH